MPGNTIRNIYLNAGTLACSGHIHDFFSKNAPVLQSVGIHYPDFSDPLDLPGQRAAYSLINAALTSSEALDTYLTPLHELARQSGPAGDTAATLVVSCPSLFRYAKAASTIQSKLRSLFPGATIHYFGSFCHQHMEIAALCAISALHRAQWPHELVDMYTRLDRFDYQAHVHAFQASVPGGDFCFHLSHEEENADERNALGKSALDAFLAWMGIDPAALSPEVDRSAPSRLFARIPREWLDLTASVNGDAIGALPLGSLMPHMMERRERLSPLLDNETRRRVHECYAESNRAFCTALGGAVFAPPATVRDPESPQLTSKMARQLVDGLDASVVDTLRRTLFAVERPSTCELLFFRKACARHVSESAEADAVSLDVLTLTYNHEKYIEECITSVLAQQTNFPVRHIIVDDASDDATPNIVARYAKEYPTRIFPIFLQKKRRGDNVRMLFRACDSKYAALCDGDDYFTSPLKLQKQVDFLESRPHCALCFHPVAVVFENGKYVNFVYPPLSELPRGVHEEYYLADLIHGNMIQTNSVVYRWRFRDGVPAWFRPDLCPGDWYWHLLHAETGKIGFLREIMAVYRRHESALYSHAFISVVEHRREHGMAELATFQAVNEHFNNRYFLRLASLAAGVFAQFFEVNLKEKDSTLLDDACAKFPEFAQFFFKALKAVRKGESIQGE